MKPLITASSSSPSSLLRKAPLPPYLFSSLAFILFVAVLYGENLCMFGQQLQPTRPLSRTEKEKHNEVLPFAIGKAEEGCDIFGGRWVRDESTRPHYEESQCPYIQPQLTCQAHGRPDKEYQFWRWQPHRCSLPRFNATLMLETLRGKRMMFVGDSLNRGQFVSMVCLLQTVIPEAAKSMETIGSLTVFTAKTIVRKYLNSKAVHRDMAYANKSTEFSEMIFGCFTLKYVMDYNARIEFYWAPFLLESNSANAIVHRVPDRMVRKGSINKHGKHWRGVDIIVFNTYLWWMTGMKMKVLRGSFEDEVKDFVELSTEDAYRMAMKSMVRWAQKNMDPKKTRVFFVTMSPLHTKSIEWGGAPGGNCYNETAMIEDPNYWGPDCSKSIMRVIGEVLGKTEVPVTLLNITQLSSYRKDAHTSIHKKQWNSPTAEQLANPASYADCVHWCLPGLQDTWNELLFTKLFHP